MLYSHRRVSPISRFAANRDGSRFPIPGEIGNGGFPDSRFRPNRESGIPSPIPGRIGNRGNGNRGLGFPGLDDGAGTPHHFAVSGDLSRYRAE
jgi:hypothetical protein